MSDFLEEKAPEKGRKISLKRELRGLLCLLLALGVFCALAVPVLIPKRHDYGATWAMYEKEPKDSIDALFFGSSLAYCDLVPAVIYEETGLTAYLMAGPSQTLPITYRYVKESLRTQSPKAVFIEATGLLYERANRSIKVNLTYMPYNLDRLIPTLQEAQPEERAGLLFPLYAYHDRWDKLTDEDWEWGLGGGAPDPLAGYTFLDRAFPLTETRVREFHEDPENYARNLSYAQRIVALCREERVSPVFFLAPNVSQPSPELQKRLEDDLTALGAEFWNCNQDMDSLGLDFSADFFDDVHFNYRGAEKFSRYFGNRLVDWGLAPGGREDKALWASRIDHFADLRAEWDSKPPRLNQSLATPGE